MPIATENKITRGRVYRFRERSAAESFRRSATKPLWLVIGAHGEEAGEYLVACPADCARLARAGYEYA